MHYENTMHTGNPFDEFLAYLLAGTYDSTPTTVPASSSSPLSSAHSHHDAWNTELTCQWVFQHDPPLICGATLSQDPKEVCNHFRNVHDIRGNEREIVCCRWRDCPTAPMQRGSLIRHILAVHLDLLKWRCERCSRVFSRKGTGHVCVEGG